jgi:NAD(P)H-flavin reductase
MTIVLKTDIPGGIGQKLLNLAPNSTPVLVDGPYGCSPDLSSFENILLMSGGSGASFVVSLLEDLGEKYAQGKIQAKRIVLHWAVRGEGTSAGGPLRFSNR